MVLCLGIGMVAVDIVDLGNCSYTEASKIAERLVQLQAALTFLARIWAQALASIPPTQIPETVSGWE